MPTIGIAICCYKGHIPQLKTLLDSIQTQVVLPDDVVVSCSSSTPEDIPYKAEDYRFPLRFITHTERLNAAQNRNCAASHLTTDLISFFDADDVMHPQRLQFIQQCFTMYPDTNIFLHNCIENMTDPFEAFNSYYIMVNALYRCPWGSTRVQADLPDAVPHNAHSTVRREVMQTLRFNEHPYFEGREDTLFCTAVISKYPYRTAYCHNRLSRYIPSRTMNRVYTPFK
jgi:glycosyltransferase involved in cell wall biosynthesis